VCVPSEDGEEDGHDWVDEAAEMGAVAVIAEPGRVQSSLLPVIEVDDVLSALAALAAEFYDQPAARMNTVAFIGSYGKTTTSWLARGVFEENEELALMVGDTEYALAEDRLTREGGIWVAEEEDVTLHRDCSVPFHIVPYRGKYELPVTTPDGLHLQKVLAGGADRGAESALVELCPHLLRDGRADSFRPQIVVFTNADEEKACVDGEDFDEYLERIGEYFAGMDVSQIAIINKDDIYGDSLERLVEDTGAQVLTYGVNSKDADVHAEKVKSSIWETEILVRTPVGRLEIIVPLIGEFNVSNVLAAVAVGLARGIKLVNIVAGIEAVDVIPVRFNFWFSTWHGAQSRSLAHSLTHSLMHTSISRVGVNWWRRDSRSR
jgi:UDP-N-acetylmuramyl tripeptide synthase